MGKKILIIEDERNIVDILTFHFDREGFETLCALDGRDGLDKALSQAPDLILLDVMLPLIDGWEVCRTLRKTDKFTPVIMLTAREEEPDKILGLELGADDYITKPFSIKELMARVRANIRRTSIEAARPESAEMTFQGGLALHTGSMEATIDGARVELSQREYELLLYLVQRRGAAVSREELMQNVWRYDYLGDLRAVDVAVRRLREKIEKNPAEPMYIVTKRGAGYMFKQGPE